MTAADLDRLEEGAADSSRIGAMLFLLLALLEAGLVIVQRYQVRVGQLPYRWVQRWVLWRAGTAAVLVLVMLLPAASDVPAWRWRSQTSPAREAYNTGCQAADAGDAAAAERAWRRAVALDPGWQPAWFNLGTLLATQPGRQQEALQAMARAMQLDPADLWAKENHATLRAAMQAGHHPVVAILPSPSPIPDAQSSAAGSRTEGGHAPGADQTKGSGSGMAEVAGEMRDLASRLLPGVSDVMAWTERGQGHPSEVQPSGGLQPGAGTGRAEQDAPAGSGGTPDLRNVDLSSLKKGQGGQPQPLPSLRPQDVDRLLGQAENLSEKALQHLQAQQDGQAPTGQLPSLTPEQWARMAALAARMGVQAQDLQQRDDPTSPYVEPAKPSRSTLHW